MQSTPRCVAEELRCDGQVAEGERREPSMGRRLQLRVGMLRNPSRGLAVQWGAASEPSEVFWCGESQANAPQDRPTGPGSQHGTETEKEGERKNVG